MLEFSGLDNVHDVQITTFWCINWVTIKTYYQNSKILDQFAAMNTVQYTFLLVGFAIVSNVIAAPISPAETNPFLQLLAIILVYKTFL